MDILIVALIIIGCYCVLLFFDLFFKSCAHYPYLQLLEASGLNISYLSIKWKTRALNRLILKWGNARPQFWKVWFDIGIYTSVAFFFIVVYFLFINTVGLFSTTATDRQPIIVPIVPGVNLPLSELGYYAVALLICSIVHELGHAVAAVLEEVGILEFGCNIYFILPVAYVSLSKEKLPSISLKRQLKIFTAGVWHNIFLSFIAYLLYCSLPSIFSPLFEYGNSISVLKVSKYSPLRDSSKGLFINDVVVGINNCPIRHEDDWFDCLQKTDVLIPAICIASDLVHTKDESVPLKHLGGGFVECCDSKNFKNVCFEYINVENNELELPGHVCLPGRSVMEQSTIFCPDTPHSCPDDLYCFKPVLPNNTYLLKIRCKSKDVIYLGHPSDLIQTVEVSSYVRKNKLFSTWIPNMISKLVKYVCVISLGLAFVNILPFVCMDGEYVFQVIGLLIFKNRYRKNQIVQTVAVITWINTLFLVIYLIYSLILIL